MSSDSISVPPELKLEGPPPPAGSAGVNANRLVARNMLALVASQFVTTPVSIFVNAMRARKLGASDFGHLPRHDRAHGRVPLRRVGRQAQVAAEVARTRSAAGELFGSGVVLRVVLAGILLLLIAPFVKVMAYDATVRLALVICGIKVALASVGNLCSSIVRGFEHMNWYARANVLANLTDAAAVVPILLLGGGLRLLRYAVDPTGAGPGAARAGAQHQFFPRGVVSAEAQNPSPQTGPAAG